MKRMQSMGKLMAVALGLACGMVCEAGTIHVPADQPTVQSAINAAANGDTVQVSAGTYVENINFGGKAITVVSVSGAAATILDGGHKAAVVTFNSGETTAAVLSGFTLKNGLGTDTLQAGGGVHIEGASPTVQNNVISGNQACTGAGIWALNGSPVIRGNTITRNTQTSCAGGGGAGIALTGGTSPAIVNNKITSNTACCGDGGGIYLDSLLSPVIMNNFIIGNVSGGNGGGVAASNEVDAIVVQNVIARNTAGAGAGLYWTVPQGTPGPVLVNNTVHGNLLTQNCALCLGSGMFLSGFYGGVVLENNLFLAARLQDALYCDATFSAALPTLASNDAWSPGNGPGFDGACAGQAGQGGNITADALLVDTAHNNYRLSAGSPAIDAGNNAAPHLPAKDIGGGARIVNGNGGPTAIVDMGAYEFVP